jgi:uncharacterized membrane protein
MSSQPFFVPAAAILVVSLPLILGLIPRNRIYGIRTRKTLSDDRTWYSVNRFGGEMILAASIFYLIVAAIFPYSGAALLAWSLHLAAFAGPLLVSALVIARYARNV